jgi:hypothetical protein
MLQSGPAGKQPAGLVPPLDRPRDRRLVAYVEFLYPWRCC